MKVEGERRKGEDNFYDILTSNHGHIQKRVEVEGEGGGGVIGVGVQIFPVPLVM